MICSFEYCKEHCIFPDYHFIFFLNKNRDSLLLDSRVRAFQTLGNTSVGNDLKDVFLTSFKL